MIINFSFLLDHSVFLLQGIKNTLFISFCSCIIGFLFGIVIALFDEYGSAVIRWFITFYVAIIRGTPMLIQILGAYYLFPMIGIHCSAMLTVIIAISFNSAAYISQIVKAGIASVSAVQKEAAYVLGFSNYQTARYIVLPQAIRTVFPAISNELVTLIKDSSLASTINVVELTKQGRIMMSQSYDALSVFFMLFFVYLAITSIITYLMHLVEKRMKTQC